MDTFENVCEIVSSRFELNEIKLDRDTSWEEIGADSIDLVDLITEIEDEFKISIPDEEFENLKTIGDLSDLIDQLM